MLPATRGSVIAFATDLLLVLAFVLIGRASHDAGPVVGALVTLWPFAVGLVIGWIVGRVWRHPLRPVTSGSVVWLATVVVGMLLRALSGQGTAFSFIIVATVVLGLSLIGWRTLAYAIGRGRRRAVVEAGGEE